MNMKQILYPGNPKPGTHHASAYRRRRRIFQAIPILLTLLLVVACDADAPDIPQEICDAYEDALFTIQLGGGAAIVVGIAMIAFKKAIASIIPSQGAQVGAIATSIGVGIFLLTFSSQWGTTILGIFGLPDMYTLCGLGG
jgi:hypothetical protein